VWRHALLLVFGVLIGAAAATGIWKLKPPPAAPVTRFAFTLPQGQQLTLSRQAVALSPDGTHIAYAAEGRLYLRSMSELEPRAIAGTDMTINPVFAPDGQSLVFWANSTLRRVAVSGGVPVTIGQTSGTAPSSIAWGNDGILFAQSGTGIMRVSPNGGKPEVLIGLSSSDGLAYGPQMLPDGGTLLFSIASPAAAAGDRWDKARIVVQSLKTGERKTLIDGGTDARYVPTGHIVYALGGTIFAVPFNLSKLEVTGGSVPVIEGVRRATSVSSASSGTAHFAFSNAGSLVYVPGPASIEQQDLFLFDRTGRAKALKLPPGPYAYPRVSPDGKRLAFETSDGKEAIVSIYDLSGTSSVRRLTFGGNNRFPIWSADGQHVAFQSDRDGDPAVFWQPVDGGTAERLTKPDPGTSHVPESWSPTGEILLFSAAKSSTTSLWTLSVRDRKAMPFDEVRSTSLPTDAVFSPDGRWVAYQTGEVGGPEGTTYVQPFPPNGAKYQIARGGRPLWSRDGKELFYVPGPTQFMAVAVRTQPNFTFSNPVAVPRGFGFASPTSPRTFDITPEGRIVGIGTSGQSEGGLSSPSQIHVVLNWFEELKARVPTK
jgi:serine/threonine-protein kinase